MEERIARLTRFDDEEHTREPRKKEPENKRFTRKKGL
jgi:hypothetical protein